MAMKKAIVSTSVGCEGINLKHGESVLIADTPEQFAKSVINLFRDSDFRTHLGRNAYETVLREYNWEEKGRQLDVVYRSAIKNGRPGSTVSVSKEPQEEGSYDPR